MTGTYITVYRGSRDLATFRCTVTGAPTADTHQNSNINTSLVSTKHVYSTATDPLAFLSHSGFISNKPGLTNPEVTEHNLRDSGHLQLPTLGLF